MPASVVSTRRRVSGLAFKPCEFCGRDHHDKNKVYFNYQYLSEKTQTWDSRVFCSKTCYSAWHGMNGD